MFIKIIKNHLPVGNPLLQSRIWGQFLGRVSGGVTHFSPNGNQDRKLKIFLGALMIYLYCLKYKLNIKY